MICMVSWGGGGGGGGHYTFCKQLYFFGVKTVKQLEPICLWEILSLCFFISFVSVSDPALS